MKQNTVILNQQSVAALDELESVLKLPKSEIIQEALIKLKEQFVQTFSVSKRKRKYALDDLAGIITLKDKGTTNFAMESDDKYLKD